MWLNFLTHPVTDVIGGIFLLLIVVVIPLCGWHKGQNNTVKETAKDVAVGAGVMTVWWIAAAVALVALGLIISFAENFGFRC